LLIGSGFAAWKFYQQRRETASSNALAEATTAADYQRIVDRYGDTPAAASAYLLLADEQRKNGKLAEANATLRRFLDKFPRHQLASAARMSIAQNLEAMGKEDQAMDQYQSIASGDAGGFNAPQALLAQARILQTRGRNDEARRVCENIMTQYRQSYAAMEASQLLTSWKPTATPAPSATVTPHGTAPPVSPTPATTPKV
jgi:TolA-binding protein